MMDSTTPMSQEELARSLVVDEPGTEPSEPGKETNETVTAGDGHDTVAADAEPQAPADKTEKPGTPDKALQKLQQDQSSIQRKLDKLLDKVESGETLTTAEKAEVAKQKRKLDAIREAMKTGQGFDIVDQEQSDNLVHSLVEVDDDVQTLKQRLDKQDAELAELRNDRTFGSLAREYDGVNVKDVWAKAYEDTVKAIGEGPQTRLAASGLFHERAAAAKASVTAKTNQKPGGGKTAGNPAPGGRVAISGSQAPGSSLTPDQEYLANARALVTDD